MLQVHFCASCPSVRLEKYTFLADNVPCTKYVGTRTSASLTAFALGPSRKLVLLASVLGISFARWRDHPRGHAGGISSRVVLFGAVFSLLLSLSSPLLRFTSLKTVASEVARHGSSSIQPRAFAGNHESSRTGTPSAAGGLSFPSENTEPVLRSGLTTGSGDTGHEMEMVRSNEGWHAWAQ